MRQCLIRPQSCERGAFSRALWRRSLSVSGYLLWSYDPAMQTPSAPADSVPSLWRWGLRLAAGGREEAGGGGSAAWLLHQGRQPITHEEKELANRFSNGTPHAVIQDHKPLSSPIFHFSCLAPPRLHVSRRVMPCTQWARTRTHTHTTTCIAFKDDTYWCVD